MFLWIKAFHIISIIAWMAGLLYLPRLYVYHIQTSVGSEQSETFKVMEHRLLRYIMNPAMIGVWVFGLWLWFGFGNFEYYMTSGWFAVKLVMIVILTATHHVFSLWRKAFARDERLYTDRTYRIANEVPTLAMIVLVIMVVVKPF